MHHPQTELIQAISALVEQMKQDNACRRSRETLATKTDLHHTEHKIMSAIADFAAKVTAFNDKQDKAITGLTEDVQNLNDKITELQNSPGTINAEDQALLDEIVTHGETIATKLEALDALTPPKAPPV